ncbi:MAG TPA: hypothetical protein PKD64_03845 [Pirellulaceae bacterium]|nr:hypothetical protein [Pirellulaceae bacterium]HMO91304.1 hypothetical protein [Pirellulaceae bacterium]HMP68512.1 hypothetical protein [Pirellulaceae bacterium]
MIRNVGDLARFGAILFQVLAPLQLALLVFLTAVRSATNVSVEKDRKTLILLLVTRLSDNELVLGKLFSSLINTVVMLLTALPIFMLIVLLGGSSFQQVLATFVVTGVTALVAGSLGTTFGFWREKTFQTLALVALSLVFWIGASEALVFLPAGPFGMQGVAMAEATSPIRAIIAASSPGVLNIWQTQILPFTLFAFMLSVILNAIAVWRVRIWNPNRDVRVGQIAEFSEDEDTSLDTSDSAELSRAGHVDDRRRLISQKSRAVWDNPILWRETMTWAHGKKILFIRLAFWILAACAAYILWQMVVTKTAVARSTDTVGYIAPFVQVLVPLMLLSLVMLNALSVSSITAERDLKSIDLLMVTDLSPKEFLFGKLGGVLCVACDTVLLPILLCLFLWFSGVLSLVNLIYVLLAWSALVIFVSVLGLHCGMVYPGSRQAIGVSLSTVFFLFLGIVTAMVVMISFTGNVEVQFTPFLACIVGGGIGLYVALGSRNPSPAIALASGVLPLAMFYVITSVFLGEYFNVTLVVCLVYGFATTAMLMPALGEFNITLGRSRLDEIESLA